MKKLNRREFIKLLLVACAAPVVLKLPETKCQSKELVYTNKWITMGDRSVNDVKLHELAEFGDKANDTEAAFNNLVERMSHCSDMLYRPDNPPYIMHLSDVRQYYAELTGHEPLTREEWTMALLNYTIDKTEQVC